MRGSLRENIYRPQLFISLKAELVLCYTIYSISTIFLLQPHPSICILSTLYTCTQN
jgi:hypothetical protein